MQTHSGFKRMKRPMGSPANSNLPPALAGAVGRCPRCGTGKLYSGFLNLRPRCTACDLDFGFIDAGDGPAVFVILIVGFIVMAAALYTEVKFRPPIWVHMSLWLPLVVVLSLGLLRPMKGLLVGLQYLSNARQGRLATALTPAAEPPRPLAPEPIVRDRQT